jgi:cyclopropane fatty-acyl-phospholipid synthase-like methyltransferase
MRRKAYDRSYFDSILFRTKAASQRNHQRLQLVLACRPSGALLEIGCGKGHLMQVAGFHYDVEGLEVSEHATRDMAADLRRRIRIGDVEQLSLPEDRYDVVVAFNVLEHLTSPATVLTRLALALKPDGVLVGSVPLNYSLVGRVHTALTNVFDRTHCSTLGLGEWRRAFDAAGFTGQDLFGEIQAGPNHAVFVRGPLWPHISLNLMFVLTRA